MPLPAGDQYFSSVSLLMHMDDTTLSDVTGKAVTLNGNATRSATQSKFGGYSAYFDGAGDYLSLANSTGFDFGTGDFTIEYWVYQGSVSATYVHVARRASVAARGFVIEHEPGGVVAAYLGDSNTAAWEISLLSAAGTMVINTWHHIALSRSSGTTRLFVNGTSVASSSTSVSIDSTAATLYIGIGDGSAAPLNGYIDDLRITKGVARYTTTFTPHTTAHPDTTVRVSGVVSDIYDAPTALTVRAHRATDGALAGTVVSDGSTGVYAIPALDTTPHYALCFPVAFDPYWSSTTLLMHMDSTGLTDEKGNTVTLNGNVTRSATQSKFGGYSAYFDGSGDFIGLGASLPVGLQIGAGDFTIEFWVYTLGTGVYSILGNLQNNNGTGHFWVLLNSTYTGLHTVQFGCSSGAFKFGTATLSTSTWHHIALSRVGTALHCFLNGTRLGAVGSISNFSGSTSVVPLIGASLDTTGPTYTYFLNGYLDDLRVTKGVGRYVANFTPHSSAHPHAYSSGSENALTLDNLTPY